MGGCWLFGIFFIIIIWGRVWGNILWYSYNRFIQNFIVFRHSNFGGTYVMKNVKSLSDRELIYHKSIQNVDNFTLDSEKKRRQKPRNRLPIRDTPVIRRSTLSIRLSLKEFCVQFLENAYNPLMYAVKVLVTVIMLLLKYSSCILSRQLSIRHCVLYK